MEISGNKSIKLRGWLQFLTVVAAIILFASPTMINVINIVRKVAATDANVLITGEVWSLH